MKYPKILVFGAIAGTAGAAVREFTTRKKEMYFHAN